MSNNPEKDRLANHRAGKADWQRWGTYLSDRAWGTVREDYSANGDAWNYFPHEHARSRAYRWNEDGIGGFCDDKQHICLAVALWNEKDPILKERMFGLGNSQGNHGEDVKEYYFFLDGTPTHSYMKMLYKYPHVEYPYDELVAVNGKRDQSQPEYELFDALKDVFLANRYFDVFIEYAKAGPEDILFRITAINRGPDAAAIHILPHLWYRNVWSWETDGKRESIEKLGPGAARTSHPQLGNRWWYVRASDKEAVELLFTENETNLQRIDNAPNLSKYVKDGIHHAVVAGNRDAVNLQQGSKLAGHARAVVAAGGTFIVEGRFSPIAQAKPFADFDSIFAQRIAEANTYYDELHPPALGADEQLVARQAFAGLLWSKQYYHYDVFRWLKGDPTQPIPPDSRWKGRNSRWKELHNAAVILMPDTWEYPWYASWDLAFHCVAMSHIDPQFAKHQLRRMGHEWYQHANGQFPAYEWNFDDVNPPVTGWACWRVYQIDRDLNGGVGDTAFLKEIFQSEMLNFSYWLNRKDRAGRDIFGGGFLGMDNIGVFDRDKPLPDGGRLEQSDGTSWMALYCITMLTIATELAKSDPIYQNMAIKYFEHFLYIAHAMANIGGEGINLWDAKDEFFYDVILLPSKESTPLRIHSMVGLVPLFAVFAARPEKTQGLDEYLERAEWFIEHRPDLLKNVASVLITGEGGRKLMSILNEERLTAVLRRMLDPEEFFSDYGIRALSRYHLEHPFVFDQDGHEFTVKYLPGEADSRLFGGNSNWRGPIWFPVNYMIVRSLHEFSLYFGDRYKVECPTGSGQMLSLDGVAKEIAKRLCHIFLRDPARNGWRAVWGDNEYFQTDPDWRDCVPFFEYFHGDTGAGVARAIKLAGQHWLFLCFMNIGRCGGARESWHSRRD